MVNEAVEILAQCIADGVQRALAVAPYDKTRVGVIAEVNDDTFTVTIAGTQHTAQNITHSVLSVGDTVIVLFAQSNTPYIIGGGKPVEVEIPDVTPTTDYLPLSGGTLSSDKYSPLTVKRTSDGDIGISFENALGILGSIYMNAANGSLLKHNSTQDETDTILDTSNFDQHVTASSIGAAKADHSHTPTALGIDDYIIKQGVSGIWTYRKWNSGIAECWGSAPYAWSNWSEWGSLYEATPVSGQKVKWSYPFEFAEVPAETATPTTTTGAMLQSYTTNTTISTSQYFLVRPDKPGEASAAYAGSGFINFHVLGRWK